MAPRYLVVLFGFSGVKSLPAVLGLLCWLLPAAAAAAGAAPALEGFEPAQIERQVEQVPVPESRHAPVAPLPAARTRVELDERSFTLAGVLVEGATVYENVEFLRIYRPWLGRAVTVRDLREIAEAITRLYQEDGYFLSSAFLPAQDIGFGIVRVRVIEGHIGAWRFADGAAPDPLIDRMLRPALDQRPLRRPALVSALRLVNGLPGLSVTPELRPVPQGLGVYELVLAADVTRFDGGLSIDNRGSELIGPVRAVATLRAHGLAGRHESLQLKLATAAESEELRYVEAAGEWPLGARGLRLQLLGSQVRSRPGGDLAALDARIANERQRLGLSWTLPSEAGSEQRLGVHLERYRSRTDVLGARRLEDRLHVLNLAYKRTSVLGTSRLRSVAVSVSQGLDIGDDRLIDTQAGRGAGRPDFTRVHVNYGWRALSGTWELTALADGQYAATELPSAERYTIGGGPFGSAYDPSEISGDHGLAGRLELARRLRPAMPSWRLTPYASYELGAVWNITHPSRPARLSAASLAAGLRAGGHRSSLSLELAQPLTRPVASQRPDGKSLRAFATFSLRF